jgi:hypothetical protein
MAVCKLMFGDRIYFHCPGCGREHCVKVPNWTFNGDYERPTFSPSVLYNPDVVAHRCHFFVRDGQIEYLEDCHHRLRGRTVPMLPIQGD